MQRRLNTSRDAKARRHLVVDLLCREGAHRRGGRDVSGSEIWAFLALHLKLSTAVCPEVPAT
eukprot:SAG11_NODE_24355_length_374_cov_1.476364_1_plen_61_part_10